MSSHISLDEFEQRTRQLLLEVINGGRPVVIIGDGRALLELRPCPQVPVEALRGKVIHAGDLVSPIEPDGYQPFP